jgi:hypothetical protein
VDPLGDGIGMSEGLALMGGAHDHVQWRTHWKLEKREGDGATYPGGVEAFRRDVEPFETLEWDGNALVTIGGESIWDLVIGLATYTAFDAANAYLGVGDSAAAENVAQTDLLAGVNKLRKGMNGTYPQYTGMVVTFQSDFTAAEATWTWAEVGTFNAAAAGQMLNRKVQALGVKGAGATWTLTETITLS